MLESCKHLNIRITGCCLVTGFTNEAEQVTDMWEIQLQS